jgi:hypothetical protein
MKEFVATLSMIGTMSGWSCAVVLLLMSKPLESIAACAIGAFSLYVGRE